MREVIELYQSGLSIRGISGNSNFSREKITAILKNSGIIIRKIQKHFSNEVIDTWILDYLNGTRVTDISSKYNVAPSTVRRNLKKRGVKLFDGTQPKNFTSDIHEKWIELYMDGKSLLRIAEIYNVNKETVREYLVKAGVDRRESKYLRKILTVVGWIYTKKEKHSKKFRISIVLV